MPVEQQVDAPSASEAPEQDLGLEQRIVLAAMEIDSIAKRGRNTQQNYSYARWEDIVAAVREGTLKHGIVIYPSWDDPRVAGTVQGNRGPIPIWEVKGHFVVTNAENPDEQQALTVFGHGMDFGDKGIYKAYTGAYRYLLMHLFQLPIEAEEPERDNAGFAADEVKAVSPASPSQQRMLNGMAASIGLPASEFANLVRGVAGAGVVEYGPDDEERAQQHLGILMDRLPANLVDPVIKALEGMGAKKR